MITVQPLVQGGSTTTFGTTATVTLTAAYNGGAVIDGSHYVIAPHGIDPVATSPAEATIDTFAGNGAMANIQVDGAQALDASALGFDAGASINLAAIYRPGSCLVKVKTDLVRVPNSSGQASRSGAFEATTALHVVAAAPAAGAMAPVAWPSADLANKPWRVANIDAFLAGMPTLASSGLTAWATIAAYWDKLDISRAITTGISYQYLTPKSIAGVGVSAYGEYRGIVDALVWAGICGNTWSTADKTAAAIRMMSNGCQKVEAYRAFNKFTDNDGGQHQDNLGACLAWLKATGQTASYASVLPNIGGHLLGQYYQVTAGQFNPHDDPLKPYIARRRTVSSITGAGPFVITCTDYRPAGGLTGDTATNGAFDGLNIVRESNGAVAAITAEAGTGVGTGWQFTVATLPTGLVVGNVIYCAQVTPMSVGTYDWMVRPPALFPNLANPGVNIEYRKSNFHGNNLLPISAMGMRGALLQPCREYVTRIPDVEAFGTGAHVSFWSTHKTAVMATTQLVA